MFEWLADPTIWAGLAALIVLEIVLGIDNLVFIAILAEKLPPHQRDKARVLGLSLALLMRLCLLMVVSWLVTLTQPLFSVFGHAFSGRDLILLAGGLFLLFKATMELHERLEGRQHHAGGKLVYASFALVVAQIVVLDAVFSIDSVITAIGMTEELGVMMVAMVIAMGVMLLASKQLTTFVNAHPTLIVLCLGFLLMIGFSLVAEGIGLHIPKGYLYAAISFSIMVETLNQLARHNKEKWLSGMTIRERTVHNVMRMMGVSLDKNGPEAAEESQPESANDDEVFKDNERDMIRSILMLNDINVKSLMTQRREVGMLDISIPMEQQQEKLLDTSYSKLVVIQDGKQDEPLGVVQKKILLSALLRGEDLNISRYIEQPVVLIETQSAMDALEAFRIEGKKIAFVVDEFGTLEGIISLTDLLEAIAGHLNEADTPEEVPSVIETEPGVYLLDASESLEELNRYLPIELPRSSQYTTLAGLLLNTLERMPVQDEIVPINQWQAKIVELDHMRIARVELRRLDTQTESSEAVD